MIGANVGFYAIKVNNLTIRNNTINTSNSITSDAIKFTNVNNSLIEGNKLSSAQDGIHIQDGTNISLKDNFFSGSIFLSIII